MKLNNLSKIIALLRQVRKGNVDEPITDEDIALANRELSDDVVEKKIALEQKSRQEEIDRLEKSNQEMEIKKKIAEESIKKIRSGKSSVDRKNRIEEAKKLERESDFSDFLKENESTDLNSGFEEKQEPDESLASDADVDAEELQSDFTSQLDSEKEEIPLETAEAESFSSDIEIEDSEDFDQFKDDSEKSSQNPPNISDEYALDSDEAALPALEEMNFDTDTFSDESSWGAKAENQEDANKSALKDNFDDFLEKDQSELPPEDGSLNDFQERKVLDNDDVDDDQDQDQDPKENTAKVDQKNQFEEISADEANEVSSGLDEVNEPLTIDEKEVFPQITKLSNFDKDKAIAANERLKQSLLAPLLSSISYKKDPSDDVEEEEDDDLSSFDESSQNEDDDDDDDLSSFDESSQKEVEDDDDLSSFDESSQNEDDDDDDLSSFDESSQNEDEDDDLSSFDESSQKEVEDDDLSSFDESSQKEVEDDDLSSFDESSQKEVEDDDLSSFDESSQKEVEDDDLSSFDESSQNEVEDEANDELDADKEDIVGQKKNIGAEEVDVILAQTDEDEIFSEEVEKDLDGFLVGAASEEELEESNYEKALALINTYEPRNRMVLLNALRANRISEKDADRISSMVLEGREESEVVSFVQNQIYQKNYRENFQEDFGSRGEEDEAVKRFYKKQRALGFFRLIAATVLVAATAFFIIFYGIDMVHSEILYRQSYANLEDKRYDKSEEKFDKAYSVFPNTKWVNRIADLYVDRGLFVAAEKKYLQGLEIDDKRESVLNEYAEMLMIKGEYDRSWLKYQQNLKYHPDSISVREGISQLYIEWGIKNKEQLLEGDKILNELISLEKDKKIFYLAKKLEIASLRENYLSSKFYYEKIKSIDDDYVDKKSFRRYSHFLSNHYQRINTKIKGEDLDPKLHEKNDYIFFTVRNLIKKVFEDDPKYLPFFHTVAHWFRISEEDEMSQKWLGRGVEILESGDNPVIFRENFSPTNFYNLQGKLFYDRGEISAALESFQKSINYKKDDSIANYYQGRIHLLKFNDIANAEKKFKTAYFNWDSGINDDYRDLVYSFGYVNYKQGKEMKDEVKLQRSLDLWHKLLQDEKVNDNYSIEFALGLTYLSLGRFELAESFIDESINDLIVNLEYYQKTGGRVPKEVLERVQMLSDNYNNMGVVYVSKALTKERGNRYINKQKAIEHFIDSITLKEKLNLLRGVPYGNFNRVNEFPQISKEFLLADVSLPKTLLP